MGLQRYMTGVAIAALLAGSAMAQTAPPAQPAAAGHLNPAAESAPVAPPAAPAFQMSDGILATVNDSVITGFDLRQRMLLLIAMTQVQPTPENIPAIQQQALNLLIDERLQAGTQLRGLASATNRSKRDHGHGPEVGAAPRPMSTFSLGGIRPSTLREQLRTQIGWSQLVGGCFQSARSVAPPWLPCQAPEAAQEAVSDR
jgi:peptidyl-prolyl cis-trans isomerase SurA